jgi:5-methylcytosine-specific restriction endonuclease McrBC GTP-binding regulatory subunit McrB
LIKEKSYFFALEIIGLYKTLLKQNEYVLSKQLLKSGTSIGAKVETFAQPHKTNNFVIPAKAGIRAPGSGRDQRGASPLTGDAHPR